VLTAKMPEGRGQLVGALIVQDADEIFAITSSGVVIRMSVQPLRYLSRPTGGVKLVSLSAGATVVAVAHNGEAAAEQELPEVEGETGAEGGTDGNGSATPAPSGSASGPAGAMLEDDAGPAGPAPDDAAPTGGADDGPAGPGAPPDAPLDDDEEGPA